MEHCYIKIEQLNFITIGRACFHNRVLLSVNFFEQLVYTAQLSPKAYQRMDFNNYKITRGKGQIQAVVQKKILSN
jgi:hypothetical protein